MICVIAAGSVTVGPIHQTAFCPNSDRGILVIISEASIVTVVAADAGTDVLTTAGFTNVFGCQSSKKNPIVLAIAGSTPGIIVVSPGGITGGSGGGSALLFLQLIRRLNAMMPESVPIKYLFMEYRYLNDRGLEFV